MPRKYSVEFKEKAVHQIIGMVRLESCLLQRAFEQVGELSAYHAIHCRRGTATVPAHKQLDTLRPLVGVQLRQHSIVKALLRSYDRGYDRASYG